MRHHVNKTLGKITVGEIRTCLDGEYKVLVANDSQKVLIRFLDTGNKKRVSANDVVKGSVSDQFARKAYGVGFIGNTSSVDSMGNTTKQKELWSGMFTRVFSGRYKAYDDVSIEPYFHSFERFEKWVEKQKGYELAVSDGWELDKDLLSDKDNIIYSRDTCVFLPQEVNVFLINKPSKVYARGVSWCKVNKKYAANLWNGEYEYFDDEWSAFLRHKAVKEGKAKELAMKYRKDLDTRVFDHLMSYDVKIV